jgi:hypothetical protein
MQLGYASLCLLWLQHACSMQNLLLKVGSPTTLAAILYAHLRRIDLDLCLSAAAAAAALFGASEQQQ